MRKKYWNRRYNFAVLILAFALATLLIFRKDSQQAWKQYQREYFRKQKIDSAAIAIKIIRPTLTGKPELCLTCHLGLEEISSSHPVESFGCIICHGGEPLTLDKELAHKTLRGGKNPSDLQFVEQSCGTSPTGVSCHSGYNERWHNTISRVDRSLQSTACGAIAFTRFTFGLQESDFPVYGTRNVSDDSVPSADYPAELHDIFQKVKADSVEGKTQVVETNFVNSCLSGACHLNSPAVQQPYFYRSTGCAACHYRYSRDGTYQGKDVTIRMDEPGHGTLHELTTAIPYSQCNHCHNRGIYSLKQMQFIQRDDLKQDDLQFLSAQERRRKEYYIPLAEYAKCEITLDCIDCHTHNEVMGNGHIFPNKKAAVEMKCKTCHGTLLLPPDNRVIASPEQRDVYMANFNPNIKPEVGDTVAATSRGTFLPAVRKRNGRWEVTSKVDGRVIPVPQVYGSKCTQDPEKQDSESCHRCHDMSHE